MNGQVMRFDLSRNDLLGLVGLFKGYEVIVLFNFVVFLQGHFGDVGLWVEIGTDCGLFILFAEFLLEVFA